jgi:hypothetical protein
LLICRNTALSIEAERAAYRNFTHPRVARPLTISGDAGDDAKKYQENAVKAAIAEATG